MTQSQCILLPLAQADTTTRWWKVKAKSPAGEYDEAAPSGLVPASYLVPVQAIKQVKSVYAYEPQNEEELAVDEDEQVLLFETSEDWVLVGKASGTGVGYIPAAWIEVRRCGVGY